MYFARNIADKLLQIAGDRGYTITNLHLQKMLYYAQGYSYAFYHQPLFCEDIEAWKYGPVVPEVYNYFRRFVAEPISGYICDDGHSIDPNTMTLLNIIVNAIGNKDPWALVNMTHSEAPWKEGYSPYCIRIIPKDSIEKYFMGLVDGV